MAVPSDEMQKGMKCVTTAKANAKATSVLWVYSILNDHFILSEFQKRIAFIGYVPIFGESDVGFAFATCERALAQKSHHLIDYTTDPR